MPFPFSKVIAFVPAALLVACSVTPPQPPPAAEPQVNREVVKALGQIDQLESELQELRNLVEIQQFELENLRRQQNDLYTDIDRRLTATENIALQPQQPSVSTQSPAVDTPAESAQGDIPVVDLEPGDTNEEDVPTTEPAATVATTQPSSADEAYQQGFEFLKQRQYADAIEAFEDLIYRFPDSDQADDGYYWIGEALYVTRDYQSALVNFETLVERYPESERVPEAILKKGYIQYETRAYPEARTTLTELIEKYPEHYVAPAARTRLQLMTNQGN